MPSNLDPTTLTCQPAGNAGNFPALSMVAQILVVHFWSVGLPSIWTITSSCSLHGLQAKLDLEAQMRENARRRREAPMSEIEKTVNKPLLKEVDTYEATHMAKLKPYPAEFLPKDLQETQRILNEHHARRRITTARGLLPVSATGNG
jgi:hypothetical protein